MRSCLILPLQRIWIAGPPGSKEGCRSGGPMTSCSGAAKRHQPLPSSRVSFTSPYTTKKTKVWIIFGATFVDSSVCLLPCDAATILLLKRRQVGPRPRDALALPSHGTRASPLSAIAWLSTCSTMSPPRPPHTATIPQIDTVPMPWPRFPHASPLSWLGFFVTLHHRQPHFASPLHPFAFHHDVALPQPSTFVRRSPSPHGASACVQGAPPLLSLACWRPSSSVGCQWSTATTPCPRGRPNLVSQCLDLTAWCLDLAERCPDPVEAAQIKGGGDYIFSRDPCLFLWLGCTSRDRAGLRAYTFARPCGGHARRLGWAGSAPPPLVGADRSPNLLLLEEAVPQSAAIGRRSGEQLLLLVQSWHGLRHSARHRLAPASGLRQAPSRCHSLPVMESHGKGSSGPPPPGF